MRPAPCRRAGGRAPPLLSGRAATDRRLSRVRAAPAGPGDDEDPPPRFSPVVDRVLVGLASALVTAAALLAPGAPAAPLGSGLTSDEAATVALFKQAAPSVVYITTLGERRDAFTLDTLETPSGAGSGLVWDATHVVTNYHVVRGADDLRVTLSSGAELAAKLVGQDADRDIAVLELGDVVADGPVFGAVVDGAGVDGGAAAPAPTPPKPRPRLVPIVRGSSASLQVGQRVLCIGNPFGLDHTLTTGVLSGTGREIPSGVTGRPIQGALQASCALNPGNSGGAMLDSAGRVIGVNTAIYSPSGASAGVGFAVPIDAVASSASQIIASGRVVRPVLGIALAPDQATEVLGVRGVLVLDARPGGPAAAAGVRGTKRDASGRLLFGDVIVGFNGAAVKSSGELYKALDGAAVGDDVALAVLRGDGRETVTVKLGASSS